jgi:uncharacterized protein (TIGR03437 family)
MKTIAILLALSFAALAQQPIIDYVVPAAGIWNKAPLCHVGPTNPYWNDGICATIADHSYVTIYGHNLSSMTATATTYPWPTSLGGISLSIVFPGSTCFNANGGGYLNPGGTAQLQLLYVSPNQINALLSWEGWPGNPIVKLAGSTAYIKINNVAPALFAFADNSAAALHPNYKVVSTSAPAAPGEYIALYATGLAGAPAYGQANPDYSQWLGKVTVTVDGIQSKISFLGHAPGYDGLDQVNIQVPAGVHRGTSVPISMTADDIEGLNSHDGCGAGGPGWYQNSFTSNTVMLPIQ